MSRKPGTGTVTYTPNLCRKAVVECVIEEVAQVGSPCERIADRYEFRRLEGSYSVRYKDSDAGEGEEERKRGSREGRETMYRLRGIYSVFAADHAI